MEKVFKAYATRRGVQESTLRFLVDGERVQKTDTPKSLELADQDQSTYNPLACVLLAPHDAQN